MKSTLIIGCGIAGLTACRLLESKTAVYLCEKDRIGGLCVPNLDYYDRAIQENSYAFGAYGEHIFHTENPYIAKLFKSIYPTAVAYEHRTEIFVNGKFLPYPPNIKTLQHATVDEIVAPYTAKQWGEQSTDDITHILKRFTTYNDYDYRTFKDRYQYVPYAMDYGKPFISPDVDTLDITNHTEMDYEDVLECDHDLIINTSPLDKFYGKDFLKYRSLEFEVGIDYGNNFKDRAMTINYPERTFAYTRVHHHGKYIVYEYPSETGLPMYPVYNPDKSLELIRKELPELQYHTVLGCNCRFFVHKCGNKIILHVGRLGSYQYLNIDKAMMSTVGAITWLTVQENFFQDK